MRATIYHNPRCSTSRKAMQRLTEAGVEPTVVRYLDEPFDRPLLERLLADAGLSPRQAVRRREKLYTELGLEGASDSELLDAMVTHPILVERPIVVTEKGTRLARPVETVDEIL